MTINTNDFQLSDAGPVPAVVDLATARSERTRLARASELLQFIADQIATLTGDYPLDARERAARRIEAMWAASNAEASQ